MSVRGMGNPAASASHIGKRGEKRKKSRFHFNKKSCMAMAVSAALLFTSVDCMAVRAEEPADMLLSVAEEENPEISGSTEASDAGPLIISSFKDLEEEVSRIELEERESLEDVRKRMPETLTAYVVTASSVEYGMNPDEVQQPVEGEMKSGEDETKPDEEETSEEGETKPGEEEEQPDSVNGANDMTAVAKSEILVQDSQGWRLLVETGENGVDHAGGETDSAYSDDVDNNGGEESEGDSIGSAESGSGDGSNGGTEGGSEDGSNGGTEGGSEDGSNGGAEGENEDGNTEGIENGNGDAGSGTGDGSTDDMAGGNDTGTPAVGEGENPDITVPSADDVSLETGEVEIPVTWECENYDTEELDVYTFVPKWDETKWVFEESEEHKLPTIEVVYIESGSGVSTEEELAAAFAAGADQITLKNDISLTRPLKLPAEAKISLDGKGYSLLRGKTTAEDGSSSEFTGVMICMDGEDYTEDTYGRLTLKNITVNGKTEADHAGAPAIVDRGGLTLEAGAVVTNNYNYGNEEGKEKILPYGGGIQVYRELTVMEESSIAKNFAKERGGGVYLFNGSTLYLYADVIKDNSVGSADGGQYGADLYAESGSRIYFDPSIDMEQSGFYICEDVIQATQKPPTDPGRKELFIYVNENSGYTAAQITELKDALREYGYTVLEGRTDINTSDMGDWYVYDHYDVNAWNQFDESWEEVYGESNRKYYGYTERLYLNTVKDPVYTIKDWLNNPFYSIGQDRYLAQFKEHIYVRSEDGSTMMTFVGYGADPRVDFMYYDPKSDGEKVVDFDVDSVVIDTHTLDGNGFLVNTGVDESGNMSGYLLLYNYYDKHVADRLTLYRINGSAETLHTGPFTKVAQWIMAADASSEWEDQMSIQIRVTPHKIVVRQQPRDKGTDISKAEPILEYDIPEDEVSGYSGFGPLVAYDLHGCKSASSFTYSDLRMYYTNPQLEGANMLSALEKADFTQVGIQKYFIDLFGSSNLNFSDSVEEAQYLGYMKMMQTEGIALVTDRKTPFDPYLGDNLFELGEGGELPEPKALAERIHESISTKSTTELEEKVEQDLLKKAEPKYSVGNIWLKSATTEKQIRELYEDDFDDGEYKIQIIADGDIAYYHTGKENVTYKILKPKAKEPETLGQGTGTAGYTVSIPMDKSNWPAGLYTVIQEVEGSNISGYAYFTLEWRNAPKPTYNVTVQVKKDGDDWPNHGKEYMLEPESGGEMIRPSGAVTEGTYSVVEKAKDSSVGDRYTGVSVKVTSTDRTVTVDYYTVTFYDKLSDDKKPYGDDTDQKRQIVLKDHCAERPVFAPTSDKYAFVEWITADGKEFDFDNSKINNPTEIYAKWEPIPVTVEVTVKKDGSVWNGHGRDFMLLPEGGTGLIDLSEALPTGTYVVYDVTGLKESGTLPPIEDMDNRNTGVLAEGEKADESHKVKVTVNYYTVTFYDKKEDGDGIKAYPNGTPWAPKIVLKGQKISRPEDPFNPPDKFTRWVTDNGSDYDFGIAIKEATNIYAVWTYPVVVEMTVRKDNEVWENHGRKFVLQLEEGEALREPFLAVSAGTYAIYDITGLEEGADLTDDRSTGLLIEIVNAETPGVVEKVVVDYYTVTFYNENTADKKPCESGAEQNPQIILKNQCAKHPKFTPKKDKYSFGEWVTADETEFKFDSKIDKPTEIYATWEKIEEPKYKVTVNVGKDGGEWKDSGRIFALRPESEDEEMVFDLARVKKGTYHVYDVTDGNRSRAAGTAMDAKVDDGDTGITVTVENKDEAATVDYYTVTFYDGKTAYGMDTPQSPTVVLRGKRAAEPPAPDKKGHQFAGWKTEDGGSTAFEFDQAIENKTDIYAGWNAARSETGTDKKPGGEHTPDDGGGTRDTQTVMVRQEASPQAGTSQTDSTSIPALVKTLFGGREPNTGDISRIEIYAAAALAAGLMYLLLYIREKRRRGMTGGDKEVFAAELIRWAKKVCGFGK